jgi:hypothetical protein
LLFPVVEWAILEKHFDVLPAKGPFGEKPPLVLALKIVPKARQKKIFLVAKLRIKPRLVYACGLFKILEGRVSKPMCPEDGHRLLQHFLSAKVLRASHRDIIR